MTTSDCGLLAIAAARLVAQPEMFANQPGKRSSLGVVVERELGVERMGADRKAGVVE